MCREQITTFCFLVLIGSIQMIGDLIGNSQLKGAGLALHVSPAPKVFTAHQGFETFSSRFFIHWIELDGSSRTMELTPELYKGLKGPYNRKNVYGAILSYGPVLSINPATKIMFEQVSQFAFCGDSNLLQELNIKHRNEDRPITVELKPRNIKSNTGKWQLSYQVSCLNDSLTESQVTNKQLNLERI